MRKPYLLNDVPEDLWDALRSDAASREVPDVFVNDAGRRYAPARLERTGTSLNNVVGEILAARYDIGFEPTNRATFRYEKAANRSLYLRLPEEIADAVWTEVQTEGLQSKRQVIINALADHYLLSVPAVLEMPKRTRRARHGRPRGRKVKR